MSTEKEFTFQIGIVCVHYVFHETTFFSIWILFSTKLLHKNFYLCVLYVKINNIDTKSLRQRKPLFAIVENNIYSFLNSFSFLLNFQIKWLIFMLFKNLIFQNKYSIDFKYDFLFFLYSYLKLNDISIDKFTQHVVAIWIIRVNKENNFDKEIFIVSA